MTQKIIFLREKSLHEYECGMRSENFTKMKQTQGMRKDETGSGKRKVRPTGFEPVTSALSRRRSKPTELRTLNLEAPNI